MRRVSPTLKTTLCTITVLCLTWLPPAGANAAPPGQALVIGEASYTNFPAIQACALSAHGVASALQRLGFTVEEQEDASSGAIFAGIGTLARRLKANPDAPVFVYLCGYATAYEGRSFVLPASAELPRPADVLTQGVLIQSLLDAVTRNTRAPAVVTLDAVPLPTASGDLGLDGLAHGLPPSLGLLAVRDTAAGDRPTPFAALLMPALHGPTLGSAQLLADLNPQLAREPALKIAALQLPADGLYLAQVPAPSQAANMVPAAGTAPPPSQAVPPAEIPGAPPPAATVAAAVTSLPDEDQMTDAQRQIAQQALARLGYYDGRIDGIFGPETRAAIRRWQHELHAAMTGHLTAIQATQLVRH